MSRAGFRFNVTRMIADFLGWDLDETDLSDLSQRLYEGVVATGVELAGTGPRYLRGDVVVEIHPADLHALAPLRGPLVESLTERLRRESSRRNIRMTGPLQLEFVVDEFSRRGRPRVLVGSDTIREPPSPFSADAASYDVATEVRTEAMGDTGSTRLVPTKGAEDAITRSGSVGRGSRADVRLPSTRVSSLHARVHFDASGCTVRDLDSRNGTFVNDDRLTSGTVVAVIADDVVRFADTEYIVVGGGR